MQTLILNQSEYEAIEKGKKVLIRVEAEGKTPIYAWIHANTDNSSDRHSGYENAVFNGESD